jgi:hypothetical protein
VIKRKVFAVGPIPVFIYASSQGEALTFLCDAIDYLTEVGPDGLDEVPDDVDIITSPVVSGSRMN